MPPACLQGAHASWRLVRCLQSDLNPIFVPRFTFLQVHHVGNKVLSDLGGIYALGVQPGTQIHHNLVHDSDPYFSYGHGVCEYPDACSPATHISDTAYVGPWHPRAQ